LNLGVFNLLLALLEDLVHVGELGVVKHKFCLLVEGEDGLTLNLSDGLAFHRLCHLLKQLVLSRSLCHNCVLTSRHASHCVEFVSFLWGFLY
jgi:hypothetical protein